MVDGSLESLRARNRQAVVAAIQRRPGSSRAEIARRTGLSATTVSTLVAQLTQDGVVVEREPARAPGGGGRPSTGLGLSPEQGAVVGVHLGHGGTRVVLLTLDGTVRGETSTRSDVDHEPARSLRAVAADALGVVDGAGIGRDRLLGAGVAVSAPVLHAATLGSPPMLLDWGGIDVAAQLRDQLGSPVQLGNDATLGALAEWRLGAASGHDDLVYVMLSEGVGSGLVVGGRLHEGATGAAGEFGHVPVPGAGQICRCGNRGCLETVVGARALVADLAHSRGPNCTLDDLLRLADDGDAGTMRLLADAGRTIGGLLAALSVMLDPAVVVIGGDLSASGLAVETVSRHAHEALGRSLPPVSNRDVPVLPSALRGRSEALGAALLASDHAALRLVGATPGPA